MTFLELCVRVRQESGISGEGPLSVVGQQGILAKVVEWVRQADNDIQSMHTDWSFLWRTADATLTTDVRLYDRIALGLADMQELTEISIDGEPLQEMTWAVFKQYKFNTDVGKQRPASFAFRPDGLMMVYPVPNADYATTVEYYAAVEPLLLNDDESAIPVIYHDAILQKALMYYASHEEDNSLYQVANARYEQKLSELSAACLPDITLNRSRLFP